MHLYAILLAALCCVASNANAADRKSVPVSKLEEHEVHFVGTRLQMRGLISHEQHLFSTEKGEVVQESGYYCNCVTNGSACRRFFDEKRTDYLTSPLASALAHVQENHPRAWQSLPPIPTAEELLD